MATPYPTSKELDHALSQIMDYCMQHDIPGELTTALFDVGVGAYLNMRANGVNVAPEPNKTGGNGQAIPLSHVQA